MSGAEWATASAVVALAAFVQGAVGFGLVLVAAPLVTLIDPRLVPGPLLVCAVLLSVVMAWRERQGLDGVGVAWAFAGRVPGSVVGALLLAMMTATQLEMAVAGTVLFGVAVTASGIHVPLRRATLLAAGFLSGVMGTTTAIGGPPIAIMYQHETGPNLRGTLAGFFVMGSLLSMATLAWVGRFGALEVGDGVLLAPAALAGYGASVPATRFLDRGYTRTAVLAVSAAAAIVLLVRRLG